MKIRMDRLNIYAGPSPDGAPVEPEQRPVQRVVDMPAQVTGSIDGQNVGQLKAEVVVEGSAAQAALSERWKCRGCKHWDRREWRRVYRQLNDPTASKTARECLNSLRGGLLMTQNAALNKHEDKDGELDVESAIQAMGWCHALNQLWQRDLTNFIVTHPQACCPREMQTPQQPQGLWEPNKKELEWARQMNVNYDAILQTAATGKVPQ
jgi:hypothetical protein